MVALIALVGGSNREGCAVVVVGEMVVGLWMSCSSSGVVVVFGGSG